MHKTGSGPHWTWAVTAILMILIAWLSTASFRGETWEEASARPLTPHEARFAEAPGFAEASNAVIGNCSMCHAREPSWAGFNWPPKGVLLETEADIARNALQIYLQAGVSHAMPPPNAFEMDDQARADIRRWYRAATNQAALD